MTNKEDYQLPKNVWQPADPIQFAKLQREKEKTMIMEYIDGRPESFISRSVVKFIIWSRYILGMNLRGL